jgi:hypothetical protein
MKTALQCKFQLLLVASFLICLNVTAQWTGSGAIIYTSTGYSKVGIGITTPPVGSLDVNNSIVVGSGYAGATGITSITDGILVQGNIGIGISSGIKSKNALDINGGLAIGSLSGIIGVQQAPTNGLLVQGNTLLGLSSTSSFTTNNSLEVVSGGTSGGVLFGTLYSSTLNPTGFINNS